MSKTTTTMSDTATTTMSDTATTTATKDEAATIVMDETTPDAVNAQFQGLVAYLKATLEKRQSDKEALKKAVEDAQAALADALAEKEAAEDAYAYSDAAEKARKAADVVEFHERSLASANDPKPMPEDEYMAKRAIIRNQAKAAAQDFSDAVAIVMEQLAVAYSEYENRLNECHRAETVLDKAALTLQAKYGKAWEFHARKYDLTMQGNLFTGAVNGNRPNALRMAVWQVILAYRKL